MTFTFTYTPTYTATSTATRTPTRTYTITHTSTYTYTLTVTNTPENTYTPTATPTFTETPFPTNEIFEIVVKNGYPNPVRPSSADHFIAGYYVTQFSEEVTFSIYTKALRKIREFKDRNVFAGDRLMFVDAAIVKDLAGGVYFYVMEAVNRNGERARSEVGKIVIVR